MILIPFHLGWRDLQSPQAGFESQKRPPTRHELPSAWLTAEQNDLLTTRRDCRSPRIVANHGLDERAGRRTLEIFAVALAIELG